MRAVSDRIGIGCLNLDTLYALPVRIVSGVQTTDRPSGRETMARVRDAIGL